MKSTRKQPRRVLCLIGLLAVSVVFLGSCGASSTRTQYNTVGTFEPVCGHYGAYNLLCWTVNLKDMKLTRREFSSDNPLLNLPVGEELGEINNVEVEGTLVVNARLLVSPVIVAVPPPLCSAANPEEVEKKKIVVKFRITGNLKYAFGDQWDGDDYGLERARHSRIVIVENNLRFEQFDVEGLLSKGDDLVKQVAKNSIMREIDEAAVRLVNDSICGCASPHSLPVYSPEINNDHSDGGFCDVF